MTPRSGAPGQFASTHVGFGGPDAAALWNAAELLLARVRLAPRLQIEELAGAVRELSGREPAELFADPAGLRSLVHDDDLERYDDAIAGASPCTSMFRWQSPQAPVRWTEHTIVPWLDEHARRVGFLCLVRAVRSASSVELKRDDSYFHTLLQTINDGILVNDPDGAIDFVNSRLAAMLATTPEAMIGRRIFDYMDDESAAAARSNLKRRRQGSEDQFDFRFRREDGADFWAIVSAKPLFGPQGEHRGSLVAITDITARRRVEEDLRHARDELEVRVAERTEQLTQEVQERRRAETLALEASRTKSIFLANMSHELRTPLNAIIGYTELLGEERDGEDELQRDLGRIHGAATHLLELINNILDLSKIEAAKMEIVRERCVIGPLLDDLQSTVLPAAVKNGNHIQILCSEPQRTIVVDRTKVKQILLNLLGNAVKFTRRGWIELRVGFEREDDVDFMVAVVSDTGPGIPAHKIGSLFSAFQQADGSIARKFGGTGLGLAICRELCHLLGGDIQVKSEAGEGTTFTVRLPLLPM
ncbi:ATP-binding protein [Nannocystis sp. ILAH1]|uniref:PAS domain-containing sensor histidine kinase n=1 Tax=Nannocystis sp. ILAH1 TaxID=2996789 RepID=UPI00226DE1FC|nr:ATP-binding protein [Nannocystis sp. ILAH1]MCY0987515.1 ATP-binding protein [Nannocystis sp. ILAH1]